MRMARALSVLLVLTAVAPAAAQPRRGPPPPEAGPGGHASLFISPCGEPFRAGPGEAYPVGTWFAGADADKDGALTRTEFRADAARFFKVLDEDGDGVVQGPEVTRYERELVPEILGMFRAEAAGARLVRVQFDPENLPSTRDPMGSRLQGGSRIRPPIAGMEGAAGFTFLEEPEPVTSSDGNFDRRITAVEFAAAADRRFRYLDKNEDFSLTQAELPQTAEQRRLETGGGRKKRGRL